MTRADNLTYSSSDRVLACFWVTRAQILLCDSVAASYLRYLVCVFRRLKNCIWLAGLACLSTRALMLLMENMHAEQVRLQRFKYTYYEDCIYCEDYISCEVYTYCEDYISCEVYTYCEDFICYEACIYCEVYIYCDVLHLLWGFLFTHLNCKLYYTQSLQSFLREN